MADNMFDATVAIAPVGWGAGTTDGFTGAELTTAAVGIVATERGGGVAVAATGAAVPIWTALTVPTESPVCVEAGGVGGA